MSKENFAEEKAAMAKQAQNTRSWANMMDEEDAQRPPAPPSAAATYKAKTYLPGASNWAAKQATVEEEASAERAETPTPQRPENIEDIERNKRSYNRYRERMGLPPRPNKTPSRERRRRNSEKRRTARRRRSPSRSPSPRRRSRSPIRRYGVGRRYVAAPEFGSRRRSPSPRRRSPSPRYSRRRSPSPRYSRRRSPSPRRRNVSPLRYTIAPNGRTVNEFGRNVPDRRYTQRQAPRFNGTRGQRRPYKPANWNV